MRSSIRSGRGAVPITAVVAPTGTVASYVALRNEPDPTPMLSAATRVLLPRLLPDRSLELVAWTPGEELVRSALGTLEPRGPAVPLDEVDVVLVPALAVDPLSGVRLGRGGGSYDRLLVGVALERRWAVLAGEDELVDDLPCEPHDQPVSRVILPTRVLVIPPG